MYIQQQPQGASEGGVQLPLDYSGSVFESMQSAPAEAVEPPAPQEEHVAQQKAAQENAAEAPTQEQSVEAGLFHRDPHGEALRRDDEKRKEPPQRGGIFDKIPLLSALLPPPRGKGEHQGWLGDWKEWVLIGVALLLFLNESTDDVLPLLLLLLLWD